MADWSDVNDPSKSQCPQYARNENKNEIWKPRLSRANMKKRGNNVFTTELQHEKLNFYSCSKKPITQCLKLPTSKQDAPISPPFTHDSTHSNLPHNPQNPHRSQLTLTPTPALLIRQSLLLKQNPNPLRPRARPIRKNRHIQSALNHAVQRVTC